MPPKKGKGTAARGGAGAGRGGKGPAKGKGKTVTFDLPPEPAPVPEQAAVPIPESTFINNALDLCLVIDTLFSLPTATPSIFIDILGFNLSRHGTVSLLFIYVKPENHVYILDVLTLGVRTFSTCGSEEKTEDVTLKTILENSAVPKIFFDVRLQSDALYGQYGVRLARAEDLQVMEQVCHQPVNAYHGSQTLTRCIEIDIIERERQEPVPDPSSLAASVTSTYSSLPVSIKSSVAESSSAKSTPTSSPQKTKQKPATARLRSRMAQWRANRNLARKLCAPELGGKPDMFNTRPLPASLVLYAVEDVSSLPVLWQVYRKRLEGDEKNKEAWKEKIETVVKERLRVAQSEEGRDMKKEDWIKRLAELT